MFWKGVIFVMFIVCCYVLFEISLFCRPPQTSCAGFFANTYSFLTFFPKDPVLLQEVVEVVRRWFSVNHTHVWANFSQLQQD